jgi:hypothetical protein
VDALTEEGDEGRGIAAIRFGKVLSNLRSGDFRMGKPHMANPYDFRLKRSGEHTLGSETSQYQVEKRTIVIPLVAASETGGAQTQPQNYFIDSGGIILGMGVIRLRRCESR